MREIIRVLLHCCGNVRRPPCLRWSCILTNRQEYLFNPYYALIGHHLCQQSHSHKVTLQFCFWDFLRSIGESGVGGSQMMENLAGDEDDFPTERVAATRIANVANAYAWWGGEGQRCDNYTEGKSSSCAILVRPDQLTYLGTGLRHVEEEKHKCSSSCSSPRCLPSLRTARNHPSRISSRSWEQGHRDTARRAKQGSSLAGACDWVDSLLLETISNNKARNRRVPFFRYVGSRVFAGHSSYGFERRRHDGRLGLMCCTRFDVRCLLECYRSIKYSPARPQMLGFDA